MILLETNILLFKENTASIDKVMSRECFYFLLSCPHSPSVNFIPKFVWEIYNGSSTHNEAHPEHSILEEIVISIIVHWVVGSWSLEINDVRTHPVLELNSIFLSQETGILMVIVQVVVNLRSMEVTYITKGLSSDWTSILHGDTTRIVTKMVYTVLLSIFL